MDATEVEETIVTEFAAQGVPLSDVSCDSVAAEVGAAVRCTASNPKDTELVIEGSVTAIEDGRASFTVEGVRGEVQGPALAEDAKRMLEAEVGQRAVAMTCPEKVVVPTPSPIRCTLTVQGNVRYGVDVSVDADGELSAEVDDEPVS